MGEILAGSDMINCHNLQFSSQHSQKRMERAKSILEMRTLALVIGLALYLLGAKRNAIAMALDIPGDTLKSFFQRFFKDGRVHSKKVGNIHCQEKKSRTFLISSDRSHSRTH